MIEDRRSSLLSLQDFCKFRLLQAKERKSLRGDYETQPVVIDAAFYSRHFTGNVRSGLGARESGKVAAASGVGYREIQRPLRRDLRGLSRSEGQSAGTTD